MDSFIRPLLGMLICLMVGEAHAVTPQVQVSALGCANGVHLVADRVSVSEVLDELARVQGFRIAANARISTLVTVNSVQSTRRLLAMILGEENTIVTEEADAMCPGRLRVAAVWIVGKGSPAIDATASRAPKNAASLVTPESKAQDDLYKRAHGMLPD